MLRTRLQSKLEVGPADDQFEREADRVADEVMRVPPADRAMPPARPARIQHLCETCGGDLRSRPEDEQQWVVAAKKRPGKLPDVTPGLVEQIQALGGGQPLPPPTRAFFELRFGWDFSSVHVHVDGAAAATARALDARAYTQGSDIVYGAGERPGPNLLTAHELAHVVQNTASIGTSAIRRAPPDPPSQQDTPTFGNLPQRQPEGGRIELRQIGGKWYEIRPGLRGRVLATYRYHFAVQDGRIWASRYGHVEAARGQRVTFAGDLHFTADGALVKWDNGSGSYKPASYFATQAGTQVGLPLDKFEPTPGPKKQLQLPVIQPPAPQAQGRAPGAGGPGRGPEPRGGPPSASGGGVIRGVPPTTTAPTAPASAGVQGGQSGVKPRAVSPREVAAEMARTLREARRLESALRAVRYGLGAWQAVNVLRDVAKSVNMATAILAQGSPFAAQIRHAETIESTAKDIAQYYDSLDLMQLRLSEQDLSWNSFYDVYQAQLTFLSMEQSFHEALKEIQVARDDIKDQMNALRDEMASKIAAMTFAPTSVVHAEVMLFAHAGGKINTRLQAAARQYTMAENAIRYHRGMTRALAQWHEMRLRELGTSGVFWKIPTHKLRSTDLDQFTFRR